MIVIKIQDILPGSTGMLKATEKIHLVRESKFPDDYHTKMLENVYRGQLVRETGKYYNARDRRHYYSSYEKTRKHVCPGHYQGYRFVIENFSKPGGWVFDPFAGTGTTLVESFLLGRNAHGCEVEFFDIIQKNLSHVNRNFRDHVKSTWGDVPSCTYWPGDARLVYDKIGHEFDLIVTGPPYPGRSDVPERKNCPIDYDRTLPNFATLDGAMYEAAMRSFLITAGNVMLKPGGYFAFIVKDLMRAKKCFLLHKFYSDMLINTGDFKVDSLYLHKHWPPTFFISSYNKNNPDAEPVPRYQTIIILKKVK
jgi:hypothetical protein